MEEPDIASSLPNTWHRVRMHHRTGFLQLSIHGVLLTELHENRRQPSGLYSHKLNGTLPPRALDRPWIVPSNYSSTCLYPSLGREFLREGPHIIPFHVFSSQHPAPSPGATKGVNKCRSKYISNRFKIKMCVCPRVHTCTQGQIHQSPKQFSWLLFENHQAYLLIL